MKGIIIFFLFFVSNLGYCQTEKLLSVTVPLHIDHNRTIVDAEFKKSDGSVRKARLWIDSGFSAFNISDSLANDLGIHTSKFEKQNMNVPNPSELTIGGMKINLDGVYTNVVSQPHWLLHSMHVDGNLPATVLMKYHVIFDYPNSKLTIARPGVLKVAGSGYPVKLNTETGIFQMDAVIDGDSLSFAFDIGASFSFISEGKLTKFRMKNPGWPIITGTLGCANMWGWWPPDEQTCSVMRIPVLKWGPIQIKGMGLVGVPDIFKDNISLGEWYSKKTLQHVDGFFGLNAIKPFRVEIDFLNKLVYFERGGEFDSHDFDMIGLSVRLLQDNNYQVVGVANINGKASVKKVKPNDILTKIGNLETKGATMGEVVDALRGEPGEKRRLFFLREGKKLTVTAEVFHFL